ncbi:hypothetical protein KO525_03470 [Psychrosphaera sp. B3R10]|uniref:LPS-assembly lipoprotein LptE n=1 Tax=unclassified Psychrosphaera TaxID=2641570 RepID=UPI001C080357|nr:MULTISPECIES: LPS assembly lipoprotein LptE [unclassified Psychrosphaera]MBU2881336.1 hypothetical protein [Psychrosphaera sp. I2R16]MBU2988435.1 hypothetical protein [Psychrosphaera sp. B3R10]MDO6720065.1 LPS assembly lipoprotein LptE [Psychrosphaera sp. 1_MG-2023]
MKAIWLLIIVVICSSLNGCGFRLKGHYYLPDSLKKIHLSSDNKFSPLAKQVERRLTQNQVDLVKKKTANIAELRILPEQFQRKTLSLFPNGQVAEYELIYLVRYQVQKPNKEPLSFNFELSREFQDDPNNALAKERERQLILSELRVLASDRILSQLMMIQ